MLIQSQPLDQKFCEKLGSKKDEETAGFDEDNVKAQAIGNMFDDILEKSTGRKITIGLRLIWFSRDTIDTLHDIKYTIRNHFKWRKTLRKLRPWEGFDGLIRVMITHLQDYIETEEKYGHSEEEYRKNKIATAKETIEILERMKEPDEYLNKRQKEVDSQYPKYKELITEYKNGGVSFSGDFITQGNGWAGREGGNNPQEGYFEFIDGSFKLLKSPNQEETDRLLAEIVKYHEDLHEAYKQGNIDSDKDFERLGQLLKDNLFSWWD